MHQSLEPWLQINFDGNRVDQELGRISWSAASYLLCGPVETARITGQTPRHWRILVCRYGWRNDD